MEKTAPGCGSFGRQGSVASAGGEELKGACPECEESVMIFCAHSLVCKQ